MWYFLELCFLSIQQELTVPCDSTGWIRPGHARTAAIVGGVIGAGAVTVASRHCYSLQTSVVPLELPPGHKPEENTFPIHLMSFSQAQNTFRYVGIFRQLVYISQINTVIFKTHLLAAAQRQSLAKGSLWPCCVVKKLWNKAGKKVVWRTWLIKIFN